MFFLVIIIKEIVEINFQKFQFNISRNIRKFSSNRPKICFRFFNLPYYFPDTTTIYNDH